MFKTYIAYLKDNPKHLWFKAKLYGWGWTPATWQGWLVILVYITLMLTLVFTAEEYVPTNHDSGTNVLTHTLPMIVLTFLLIYICYKKGEKPRWQWGQSKK